MPYLEVVFNKSHLQLSVIVVDYCDCTIMVRYLTYKIKVLTITHM